MPLLTGGQPLSGIILSSFSSRLPVVILRLTAYDHLYNKERMR